MIDDICESKFQNTILSELLHLPFSNDPQVVRKWELCGKVLNENDLTLLEKVGSEIADQEIIFMQGAHLFENTFR